MNELTLGVTALILGLLGAAHCLGMCGGIMSALAMTNSDKSSLQRFGFILSYNLGRVVSYGVIGYLMGFLGGMISGVSPIIGQLLRSISGVLLILLGCYLAGWLSLIVHIEKVGRLFWSYVQPLALRFMPVQNQFGAFIIGGIWGWLPCGLVYSVLMWATTMGDAWISCWLMICFGLGTMPAMLITGVAADQLKYIIREQVVRNFSGVAVIAFGIWTIPGKHQQMLFQLLNMYK